MADLATIKERLDSRDRKTPLHEAASRVVDRPQSAIEVLVTALRAAKRKGDVTPSAF